MIEFMLWELFPVSLETDCVIIGSLNLGGGRQNSK